MAVALSKVNSFVEKLAEKSFNLGSDQLKIALTNTAHTASWDKLADLTQVSYSNLSGANPLNLTVSSSAQSSGTYKLVLADLILTATGDVGPFRYIYVYDDTATNKELIAYYDYGSTITIKSGDTFTIDFDATTGIIQIA
jgi:hypothetical protein